jgi:hypothetical protein
VSKTNELLAKANGDPQKLIDLRREAYQELLKKNPEKYGKYEKAWNARLDQLQAGLKGERSLSGMLAETEAIEDPEQRKIATTRVSQLYQLEKAAKQETYDANYKQATEIAFAKPGGWRDIPPTRAIWPLYGLEDTVTTYLALLDRAARDILPDLSDLEVD